MGGEQSVGVNIVKRGAAGPNTIPSEVGIGSSAFGIPPVRSHQEADTADHRQRDISRAVQLQTSLSH